MRAAALVFLLLASAADFGAKNGEEISNKQTVLAEIDKALGAGPPSLEYIFVRPLPHWKVFGDAGSGRNPYGHAVVRYTLPDRTQKVMNIVGDPKREMVHFVSPAEYLYGTGIFDTASEQGGVYNRGMVSVRVEKLPPEALLALDRYYAELQARSRSGDARFSLVLSWLKNLFKGKPEWGNCSGWVSKGLVSAGILDRPTYWPKELWVRLYEKYRGLDPANVHVVCYRRVRHAVQTYGTRAQMHGLVAPLRWHKSARWWDLEKLGDVIVEVPEGSRAAVVRRGR
ncbi:MAG: hypothetical protein WC728_06565 [Elusimicrobiota bacterium]